MILRKELVSLAIGGEGGSKRIELRGHIYLFPYLSIYIIRYINDPTYYSAESFNWNSEDLRKVA